MLKAVLLSAPILSLPKEVLPFRVDTDVSDAQVDSCLIPERENGEVLSVGYWSPALTETEQSYTTTGKQCLPVVWSILMLRPNLYGAWSTLKTDHESLKGVRSLADYSGRLERWRIRFV